MSFRLSRAALEIKSRQVVNVKWWEYASFAFFVPTTLVGPINPLKKHINSLRNNKPTIKDYIWFLCRLVIGTGKLFFLGTLLQRLTYEGLFFDGHPHGIFDLFICGVFYYLYLYVNFSGFCDIAIGSAGLMGIEVVENFDNPLAARNIKNFWNRWHITLSHYVRDVFFSPLSRSITHWFGPSHVQHAIALTILLIFLFIGVWHGDGWNFLLFGLVHALGMIFHHYYTLYLKRKLGSNGFENYNINKIIHCIAVTITFIYVAFSMSLFANSLTSLRKIAFILQ
jgi:D-alanyl-lipoteichoic acid acyltransferase DltB (MBOAT superfamily)